MAQSSELVVNLKQHLSCTICQDLFRQPKTLVPCLHIFCVDCIERWCKQKREKGERLTCPICNTIVDIPEGKTANLKNAFYLESLRDLLLGTPSKGSQQDNSNLPNCASCEENVNLVAFCHECEGMVCAKCEKAHHMVKMLREEHKVTSLNTEEIRCLIIKERLLDRVQEQKMSYLEKVKLSKENLTRLEKEINAVKKQVGDQVQTQIQILQDYLNTTNTTLDEMFLKHRKTSDEVQTEISTRVQQLDVMYNHGKTIRSQNVAYFIAESDFCQRCEELLQNKFKSNYLNTSVHYFPNPPVSKQRDLGKIVESVTDPSRCSVTEVPHQLGDGLVTKCEIVTKNNKDETCYTNLGSICVEIQDANGSEVENELAAGRECGRFIVTLKAQTPPPYQILVSIGGEPIKDCPKTLHGKINFQLVKIFGQKGDGKLKCPLSLALGANGEVVIADTGNHRIVIFDSDCNYVREFGEEGTTDGKRYCPNTVLLHENTIMVSDNTELRGRIQEFDINGRYIRTIYRQERVSLCGMCVTDQHIAVCCVHHDDETQSRIKVLSKQSGQLVQEIPTPDKIPRYIAYGNKKYFVLYRHQNNIDVYDEKTTLLCTFGEKRKEGGQFSGVVALAVYGEELLVCDAGSHRFQVLTHDGKFITSFGSYGPGRFQIEASKDVVVTPDGKVLVLEYGDSRVQVWQRI